MATGPIPGDPQRVYAYVSPLTPDTCAKASLWNVEQPRGYLWASGEIRCASYNHYYLPNPDTWDCMNIQQQKALAAARSAHPGGVTVLFCDGSVHFLQNTISLPIWRGLSTREGGEPVGNW